jgi:crossover junction endodeoxyribonuclease RuvC
MSPSRRAALDTGEPRVPRIMGIDPGTVVTGWGVVEVVANRLKHIAHGTISTNGAQGQGQRLRRIYDGIQVAVASYQPDEISLERVFFARNAASALKLGQARGVALLSAAQSSLPVFEYAAVEIKVAVVGYGHATKEQVQKMIRSLLGVTEPLGTDAADALAAAICHLHRRSFDARILNCVNGAMAPLPRRKASSASAR